MSDSFQISSIEITTSGVFTTSTLSARRSYAQVVNDVRRRIYAFQRERKESLISLVYRQTLRSLLNSFGGYNILDGEGQLIPVKCVFGNPERSVAELVAKKDNIILPIISVINETTENSDDRRKFQSLLDIQTVWNDAKQRAERVVSLVPVPINIIYSVGVWGEYGTDIDQIIEQIRTDFNPHLTVITDINDRTRAFITDESDTSLKEVADREDRVLKKQLEITVETYIPGPKYLLTNTGKIEAFNVELETFAKC